jgi:hypothetical protein
VAKNKADALFKALQDETNDQFALADVEVEDVGNVTLIVTKDKDDEDVPVAILLPSKKIRDAVMSILVDDAEPVDEDADEDDEEEAPRARRFKP